MTTKRRNGPVPKIDLGTRVRKIYRRRKFQLATINRQLEEGGEATIRIRDEEDSSVLARVYSEKNAVRVRPYNGGWLVTVTRQEVTGDAQTAQTSGNSHRQTAP